MSGLVGLSDSHFDVLALFAGGEFVASGICELILRAVPHI